MLRMLCVAAAALVLLLPGGAEARTRVFARVECVALFCRIVPAPDPHRRRAGEVDSREMRQQVTEIAALRDEIKDLSESGGTGSERVVLAGGRSVDNVDGLTTVLSYTSRLR
jgi:hypothetical protein